MDTMHTLQFDPFEFNARTCNRSLSAMFLIICTYKELASKLKVDPKVLKQFIEAIEVGYVPTNPYHTAQHAADVLQAVYKK